MIDIQQAELEARMAIIGQYYDLDALLEDKADSQTVAKYYRKSDFFYRMVLSHGKDYIHMGLTEGDIFHEDDFLGQAQYVGSHLGGRGMHVLELGAGMLANTKHLAQRFPEHRFTALDLPGRNFLKKRVPKNVTLVEGDYHDLTAFPEGAFDVVFGVETICHSACKSRVVEQIARVLKPGGRLIIFDGYSGQPLAEMSDFERRVSAVTLASMRVPQEDQYLGDMLRYLDEHGFADVEMTDLSKAIRPTLRRIDSAAGYYFQHRRFLKTAQKLAPYDACLNAIAGWLMLLTVDGLHHVYARIVATKGAPAATD